MILVTGGAGFIGSHIVDRLILEGFDVVVVDDLSTGNKRNLNPKAEFYAGDICSKSDLEVIFSEHNIKRIIHEAAQVSVVSSVRDPFFDAHTNVLGTVNLLECAREYEVEKLVFASSGGAVYGEPKSLPLKEDHCIAPLCPYGLTKYVAEEYLKLYNRLYGLDYTVLRYSNVYGPRQDPFGEAGVISIFIDRLLGDIQPTIFGDGDQTRDFVYVGDVAEANLLAVQKKNMPENIFNIATGVQTSVNALFDLLKTATGASTDPVFEEPRKGEVRFCALDIEKAKSVLGWTPKADIEKGLMETVSYFRDV